MTNHAQKLTEAEKYPSTYDLTTVVSTPNEENKVKTLFTYNIYLTNSLYLWCSHLQFLCSEKYFIKEFHVKITRFSFKVSAQSYLIISKSENNLYIVIKQQKDLIQVIQLLNLKLLKADKLFHGYLIIRTLIIHRNC